MNDEKTLINKENSETQTSPKREQQLQLTFPLRTK